MTRSTEGHFVDDRWIKEPMPKQFPTWLLRLWVSHSPNWFVKSVSAVYLRLAK